MQKVLEDHQADEGTTVAGPDLSNGFSPPHTQQINQPEDVDEEVEIHVLPYGVESGHEAQQKVRVRGTEGPPPTSVNKQGGLDRSSATI